MTNVVKLFFRRTIWLCIRGSIWNILLPTLLQTQKHLKSTFQYQENIWRRIFKVFDYLKTFFFISTHIGLVAALNLIIPLNVTGGCTSFCLNLNCTSSFILAVNLLTSFVFRCEILMMLEIKSAI